MKGFGKAILGGLKGAGKGIFTGLKYGAKFGAEYGPLAAGILASLGAGPAPMLIVQALKGGMAIAEAKAAGPAKASMAIALAIQTLQGAGVKVPDLGALRVALEALHDPKMTEGEFNFNLEEAASEISGVTPEQEAAIKAELEKLKKALETSAV